MEASGSLSPQKDATDPSATKLVSAADLLAAFCGSNTKLGTPSHSVRSDAASIALPEERETKRQRQTPAKTLEFPSYYAKDFDEESIDCKIVAVKPSAAEYYKPSKVWSDRKPAAATNYNLPYESTHINSGARMLFEELHQRHSEALVPGIALTPDARIFNLDSFLGNKMTKVFIEYAFLGSHYLDKDTVLYTTQHGKHVLLDDDFRIIPGLLNPNYALHCVQANNSSFSPSVMSHYLQSETTIAGQRSTDYSPHYYNQHLLFFHPEDMLAIQRGSFQRSNAPWVRRNGLSAYHFISTVQRSGDIRLPGSGLESQQLSHLIVNLGCHLNIMFQNPDRYESLTEMSSNYSAFALASPIAGGLLSFATIFADQTFCSAWNNMEPQTRLRATAAALAHIAALIDIPLHWSNFFARKNAVLPVQLASDPARSDLCVLCPEVRGEKDERYQKRISDWHKETNENFMPSVFRTRILPNSPPFRRAIPPECMPLPRGRQDDRVPRPDNPQNLRRGQGEQLGNPARSIGTYHRRARLPFLSVLGIDLHGSADRNTIMTALRPCYPFPTAPVKDPITGIAVQTRICFCFIVRGARGCASSPPCTFAHIEIDPRSWTRDNLSNLCNWLCLEKTRAIVTPNDQFIRAYPAPRN